MTPYQSGAPVGAPTTPVGAQQARASLPTPVIEEPDPYAQAAQAAMDAWASMSQQNGSVLERMAHRQSTLSMPDPADFLPTPRPVSVASARSFASALPSPPLASPVYLETTTGLIAPRPISATRIPLPPSPPVSTPSTHATSRGSTPVSRHTSTVSGDWDVPIGAGTNVELRVRLGVPNAGAAYAWTATLHAYKDAIRSVQNGMPCWQVSYEQSRCGTRSAHRDGAGIFDVDGELGEAIDTLANRVQVREIDALKKDSGRPMLQFSNGIPVWCEREDLINQLGQRLSELLHRKLTVDAAHEARRNIGVPMGAWDAAVPKNLHPAIQHLYYFVVQATRTGSKQIELENWKEQQRVDVLNRLGGAATHEEFVRKVCYAMLVNTASPQGPGKTLYKTIRDTKRKLKPADLEALRAAPQPQ